jgi:uncharacterized secreted protein with C-terminal beta-propeller domain
MRPRVLVARAVTAGSVALAVLAGWSCGHGPGEDILDEVSLRDFRTCGDLEDYIKGQALREMNATIDQLIENDSYPGRGFFPLDARTAPAPTPASAPSPQAQDYTTTNTQERDVDEADFVKNDGSRAFVLHGTQLLKLATWPPESTRLDWALPLEGQPRGMFLDGNTAVVFSTVAPPVYRTSLDYRAKVRATVLDVSGSAPRTLYELEQDGSYLNARRRGSVVRLVSHGGLRQPPLRYYLERYVSSPAERRNAYEELRRRNASLIRAQPLEEWLPQRSEVVDGRPRTSVQACSDYNATTAPVGLGLTTLSTLDIRSFGQGTRHISILNDASTVYASAQSLYVASPHWWRPGARMTREHTYLHKFDTTGDPRRARYVASGGVPGYLADQFSLDEEQGRLRVATTRQSSETRWPANTVNDVYVLEARGARLEVVGQINELAPGERIYSARFEGARGYLVTFRQVDPLFTLDLSDPRQPRRVGELKVPGFSTYLHPLDGDHLLTIGREATDMGNGVALFGGLLLQIFDVTDFAEPRLLHTRVRGTRSTGSEAEHDHKAFNYFAARSVLAIPVSDWRSARDGAFQSSLELFRVGLREGIEPIGSVDHTDLVRPPGGRLPSMAPTVRRSILMDDFVYSISTGGLKVSPLADPGFSLAVVPFPPVPPTGGPVFTR